jgi:uncharacterized membrane protein YciS (DUF1049 family)
MEISGQLKTILYWVGLGCSLVVYAHANFSTKSELTRIERTVSRQAEKEDIKRLERKIDKLTSYLLERK